MKSISEFLAEASLNHFSSIEDAKKHAGLLSAKENDKNYHAIPYKDHFKVDHSYYNLSDVSKRLKKVKSA